MKVRIDSIGWDKYTGLFGSVPFENGISTRELTPLELRLLSANIRLVEAGTDEQVGVTVNMAKSRNVAAEVVAPSPKEEPVEEANDLYTQEMLEEMAEKGGIKAIRKVGEEFGVKGVQITSLIQEILDAQKAGK